MYVNWQLGRCVVNGLTRPVLKTVDDFRVADGRPLDSTEQAEIRRRLNVSATQRIRAYYHKHTPGPLNRSTDSDIIEMFADTAGVMPPPPTDRVRLVLASLLRHQGHFVSSEDIARHVYGPEQAQHVARGTLKALIHKVRSFVEPAGWRVVSNRMMAYRIVPPDEISFVWAGTTKDADTPWDRWVSGQLVFANGNAYPIDRHGPAYWVYTDAMDVSPQRVREALNAPCVFVAPRRAAFCFVDDGRPFSRVRNLDTGLYVKARYGRDIPAGHATNVLSILLAAKGRYRDRYTLMQSLTDVTETDTPDKVLDNTVKRLVQIFSDPADNVRVRKVGTNGAVALTTEDPPPPPAPDDWIRNREATYAVEITLPEEFAHHVSAETAAERIASGLRQLTRTHIPASVHETCGQLSKSSSNTLGPGHRRSRSVKFEIVLRPDDLRRATKAVRRFGMESFQDALLLAFFAATPAHESNRGTATLTGTPVASPLISRSSDRGKGG